MLDDRLYNSLLSIARRRISQTGDTTREPEDLLHDAWPSIDAYIKRHPGATHEHVCRAAWSIISRRHVDAIRVHRGRTTRARAMRPLVCYTDKLERTAPTEESPEETRDFLRVLREKLDPVRREIFDAIGRVGTKRGGCLQVGVNPATGQWHVAKIRDAAHQLIGASA